MDNKTEWQEFFQKTKDNSPNPLLVRALPMVDGRAAALDLGAGALPDTLFLLSQGFRRVVAVDGERFDGAVAIVAEHPQLDYIEVDFRQFAFPTAAFDLVNSQHSLPFLPQADFAAVFAKALASLAPGGVFCGQFLGPKDSWNLGDGSKSFHTKEEAERLLAGTDVIELQEREWDGTLTLGDRKHWHAFDIIARKS